MSGTPGDFSNLEDGRLLEIFRQGRHDPQLLHALNEELKTRSSDEAFELQLAVVQARRAFAAPRKPATSQGALLKSGPVRDWLSAFFKTRNMPGPNRQALYRYRMGDAEYAAAKTILRQLAASGRLASVDASSGASRRAGAMFVAFCAEWFRRESESTFLKWDKLAPDLFPSVPYQCKQQLTLLGLDYWRRDLRRSADNAREFLLTLALEGGFPVRILADGSRGWLKDYLRAIMRRAIAYRVDTEGEILTLAQEERGQMRQSYRHDDFVALCAELAALLLELRRMAEAEGGGPVSNSQLLDIRQPGWRDQLPIYVPAQDEALVSELLTGLLDEKLAGLSTEGVEARRFLVKQGGRGGVWAPALQLLADGEVPPAKLPRELPSSGRVRAVATGELASHLAGDLALLEPPTADQRRWRVHPSIRTGKLLRDFAFGSPVTTTLTSAAGPPRAWTWPRGEALRSELLVFEEDEGSTPEVPLLRFLRSGSVSSPRTTLFVLFPQDWMAEGREAGAVAGIELLPAMGRQLARLSGTAYFQGGEGEAARFRVEPGTESREQELAVEPARDAGFWVADARYELVRAPASPCILEKGKAPRAPGRGELCRRLPGGRWEPAARVIDGAGLIELSWRDPDARIQLEKRLLAMIPADARVSGVMTSAQAGEVVLHAMPGWSAVAADNSFVAKPLGPGRLSIGFIGRPCYRLPLVLRPPAGHPIDVVVTLTGREAAIALADGTILPPGSQIDIGALRGAVAVAPGRAFIQITPKGLQSGGLTEEVIDELQLGVLRTGIQEMLATSSDQDDVVEMQFLGEAGRPIRISRYRHNRLPLDLGMARWPMPAGLSNVIPVARMVLDPRREYALEHNGIGLWRFPDACKGPCLLYLRDGVDVLSRPIAVARPGSSGVHSGGLVSALCVEDYGARQSEIAVALGRLAGAQATGGDLSWLLAATTNLNGLPAYSFDVLRLLPSCPEALSRLLFSAKDAGERSAVWLLQEELPFLWLQLPLDGWRAAMQAEYHGLSAALEPVFGPARAATEALAQLTKVAAELAALEPALGCVLVRAGLPVTEPNTPTLRELTSAYVAGRFHRERESSRNDFAAQLSVLKLAVPAEILSKSHDEFAGLFAPVLLAASACGRIKLNREHALTIRRTIREDPGYVSSSYPHLLKFYGTA